LYEILSKIWLRQPIKKDECINMNNYEILGGRNMEEGLCYWLCAGGAVYEGSWLSGVKHGQGRYFFPNGNLQVV
jgi:hypothetical protein